MKVSGKAVADAIAKKLQREVEELKVQPTFAIILAGEDPASRIYVEYKIKRANEIGVKVDFFEFSEDQFKECAETIEKLNADENVHGMIIQYPIFKSWNFDELIAKVDPQKDVDGFSEQSPYEKATALAIWEMLTAFAYLERFSETKEFLKGKKVVVLGRGKTAGGPTIELLKNHGFEVMVITRDTENPDEKIKSGDVVISATGVKNIVNGSNVKKGSYVIGVGVGRETIDGKPKIYGDINEEEISKLAKMYCPTVGGIGPLTIVSLLRNVISAACLSQEKKVESARRSIRR
ncbi:MAG: bifunctional 5,10-methylenetetrahydrofolate dehydrogenase/5,10-methenyltetrahydrofolate cyclohydrolase [Candidatus Daviesbacteria bacterium]|nr:bifunctional 5,10-methylenetetrahydrofolate dehydrogenase/5,10-methenyltetrahydrofolate cyclohydrolase [Candidatus Daviesbacteria bacterium]